MRQKTKKTTAKSGMVYTDPYLNLVYSIFQKMIDDLVFECRNGYYRSVYQDDAYKFFFDRKSWQHKGFLAWCDLADFSPYYWQKKAIMAIARKIIRSPDFIVIVRKHLKNKAFLLQVIMVTEILKKRKNLNVFV